MFAYCNNNPVMYIDPTGYWATYVDFDEDDYDPLDDEDKFASGGGGGSNGNAGNVYVGSSNSGGYSGYTSSTTKTSSGQPTYSNSFYNSSQGELSNDQLKNIGSPGKNSGFRQVSGSHQDALSFVEHQTNGLYEYAPGKYVGYNSNGVEFRVYASNCNPYSSIRIHGVPGLRGIKVCYYGGN